MSSIWCVMGCAHSGTAAIFFQLQNPSFSTTCANSNTKPYLWLIFTSILLFFIVITWIQWVFTQIKLYPY
jgi:hypothetical protein